MLIGLTFFVSAFADGSTETGENAATVKDRATKEVTTETLVASIPSVEPTVFYDSNDVVITQKSFEKNTLSFLIENNSLLNL